MPEPTQGMRGTLFADVTETSLPRDVADRINLLQPDDAPLIVLTNALKKKKVATEAKYEWFEDDLAPATVSVANAAGTGTAINVTTGQGARLRTNDVLVGSTGETILVTNIATDALTVTRSLGAVVAQTLAIGDQLVIVGNAMQEGSANAPFKFTQKINNKNYIQIFKDTVKLTDVMTMVKSYGGDDRTYQRMKIGIEHRRAIELAFLTGDAFEDMTGAQARRGTGGIINRISTNILDAGGVLTESDFEAFLRQFFRYKASVNAGTKVLLCAPILISAINFWAKQALQVQTNENLYGLRISTYRSGHGDLTLVRHWMLADFTEYSKYGIGLEPMNCYYRYLDGGDTKLYIDTQNKSDAVAQDEYRSYCGAHFEQEKTHGLIKNITGYAA